MNVSLRGLLVCGLVGVVMSGSVWAKSPKAKNIVPPPQAPVGVMSQAVKDCYADYAKNEKVWATQANNYLSAFDFTVCTASPDKYTSNWPDLGHHPAPVSSLPNCNKERGGRAAVEQCKTTANADFADNKYNFCDQLQGEYQYAADKYLDLAKKKFASCAALAAVRKAP